VSSSRPASHCLTLASGSFQVSLDSDFFYCLFVRPVASAGLNFAGIGEIMAPLNKIMKEVLMRMR